VLKYTFKSNETRVPTNVRKGLLGLLLLAAVGLGCFGAYEEYEWHYLSAQLKTTLTAAMDSSATQNDIATYMRDARLQVHTKRDGQVLQKFESCIELGKDSADITDRHFKKFLTDLDEMTSRKSNMDQLLNIESEYIRMRVPVPKELKNHIEEALADSKEERKRDREIYEAEEKRAKAESATALEFYKELRADLGLPPIPTPKKN
jgi:hypothetical protein